MHSLTCYTTHMSNESIFFISAVLDILFIFFASTRGKRWIFGTIVINIILASMLGGKLLPVFGFIINAGNVAYACVFLATQALIERYGKEDGYRTVGFGVGMVVSFMALTQLARFYTGLADTATMNTAIDTLFQIVPRIAIASIFGFVVAQYCNITLYVWLKEKLQDRWLFARVIVSTALAQFIDSSLFVTVAFFGIFSSGMIMQNILVGCISKVIVAILGIPLIYWIRAQKQY